MAYVDQAKKNKLAPKIKEICNKYHLKGSLSVRNKMVLVLTIKSGAIDFIDVYNRVVSQRPGGFRGGSPAKNYLTINPYHYQETFDGAALMFCKEIVAAMKGPDYYDRSDIMTDYFDTSHYFDINIGTWDTPYLVTGKQHGLF